MGYRLDRHSLEEETREALGVLLARLNELLGDADILDSDLWGTTVEVSHAVCSNSVDDWWI